MEQKERTRRAILDAALGLSDESTLLALSLRQVAKEVGIVPTAFYRHFDSIEELGLTLVEESLDTLRTLLRALRRGAGADYRTIIDGSVTVLVEQVRQHHAHFGFIARERFAGPPAVRAAIEHGIDLAEKELAADLAQLPGTDQWSARDREMLSGLIVGAMVSTAERLISVAPSSPDEERIAETTRTQLRMLLVGAINWRSQPD
ncbi:TetR family transcriptional regulator [Nocardioides sp. zg-536]|uniref:TetR family transcriptional regulator n=1 Tax=Nocardioides faecalis TaxID=2803858 RepID=A0A938Y301_9ACTN|nr:TetR family transcriptional regulator [Nocardioides faecalis]MBS4752443.1 TetR family transcriptional regulator [Nocardioides faecalis]QVI60633.1 TetR family transcriptional regulator [Nocardioides faecalis]